MGNIPNKPITDKVLGGAQVGWVRCRACRKLLVVPDDKAGIPYVKYPFVIIDNKRYCMICFQKQNKNELTFQKKVDKNT